MGVVSRKSRLQNVAMAGEQKRLMTQDGEYEVTSRGYALHAKTRAAAKALGKGEKIFPDLKAVRRELRAIAKAAVEAAKEEAGRK